MTAGASVSPDDDTLRASAILARAQRRDVHPNIWANLRSDSGLPAWALSRVFKTGDIDRVRKLQDGYRRATAGKNPIRGEILTHDHNNPRRRVPGWARRQASARGQREGWARLILRQG